MNIIWSAATLVLGLFFGYIIKKFLTQQNIDSAGRKAENVLAEARQKQKDILLEAKDKALVLIEEVKNEERERRHQLQNLENRLAKRETLFDKKLLELEASKQSIEQSQKHLEKSKEEID
jgi:ribonuclease Y